MIESMKGKAGQRAYLDAMDIPIWVLRNAVDIDIPDCASEMTLKLGAGSGGVLLICAVDTDSASKLANDINRALGSVPVWSWPDTSEGTVSPEVAVDENLFTTVAVFGSELAAQFFGDNFPDNLNSANLVLLPSMRELESDADARKMLWAGLCRSGMVIASS